MKLTDFKDSFAMARIAELNSMANQFGWTLISINVTSKLVSYKKMIDDSRVRIDIYYTTGTVTVSLNHPKKGKTQLHRRKISDNELKIIFTNPRSHTGKGYYVRYKKDKNFNSDA